MKIVGNTHVGPEPTVPKGALPEGTTYTLDDLRRPAIPACLAHLPVHGKLPIPYFTHIGKDGVPNFRAHDPRKHNIAMAQRLCGVCGRSLDYWITFILGPGTLKTQDTYMPACHEECAVASFRLCPYMALETRERGHSSGTIEIVPRAELPPKPKRVALARTRGYETFEGPMHQLYARFQRPKDVAWWHYVDGRLEPENRDSPHLRAPSGR